MSLTARTGPLSRQPAGTANFRLEGPAHALYLEPHPRRLRGEVAGQTVVDTTGAHLLHETGLLPVAYLPRGDIRFDLLEPSDTTTHCPFKGDARYWHLRVGDRRTADALWAYPDPLPQAPAGLDRLAAFAWEAMDRWLEEDAEVVGHLRDPYHRVDALPSTRHVRIHASGRLLAESEDVMALFETGFPPRWYLPPEAFDTDRLARSDTMTVCPYKGIATYYSVPDLGEAGADVAWVYHDPYPAVEGIRDRLCVAQEHQALQVDVEP